MLKKAFPLAKVVALTVAPEYACQEFMDAGADGFISKRSIIDAIKSIKIFLE